MKEAVAMPASWDDFSWYDFDALADALVVSSSDELTPAEPSSSARIQSLVEHTRALSALQALVFDDIAAIADACADQTVDEVLAWETAASEIRAALRLTRRAADTELDMAVTLRDRLPTVLDALRRGDIDRHRSRIIADGTAHLTDHAAREVAERVIGEAGRLTTGQLRERIRRLVIETDPQAAADRYGEALERRRVVMEATEEGTANLLALDVPADRAAAASRHIDAIARGLCTREEPRTMDQLRSDVMLDLLCGADPGCRTGATPPHAERRGSVDLTVDLATLVELNDAPGDLAGYGPVIADVARQIAADQHQSTWTFNVTDPDSNRSVATGVTRRRPTAAQRRTVIAADPRCIFPGCRMPATGCDLDHRTAWIRLGPTEVENLVPLCRHDHRMKHEAGWSHQPLDDGDHLWTSPLGNTYTTTGRSP